MTVKNGTAGLPPGAVIVIGSGPAGLAVALQLADSGRDVVMLESGGDVGVPADEASIAAQSLNQADVIGLPLRVESGRTRGLGGTGQLWHGQCVRLHRGDVEPRPWIEHSGWPLPFDELARWYPAAERWMDVSGRGYAASRWADHPRLPAYQWDPSLLEHDFTEYAKSFLLGDRFRRRLAEHPRLQVRLNATVARVTVADGAVSGVEVVAPDGTRSAIAASCVVIAGGAIENARILQLSDPSGIGLGDGREHTGRWLQDHPAIRTAEVHPRDWKSLQDRYTAVYRRGRKLFPKVRLAPQTQVDQQLLDATAVFVHEHDNAPVDQVRRLVDAVKSRQRPDRLGTQLLASARATAPLSRAVWRRYARGMSGGAKPSRVWLQVWLEQTPDAASRITLGDEVDRLGLRRARVDWRVGELEMQTSRVLTRSIGSELMRLGLGELRELDVMSDDDAWQAKVLDAYHPAGTARMSSSSTDGVVDTDLAVHGIEGLYVLGSSAFPTVGYANPTLTIVALGLRLASHLQRS